MLSVALGLDETLLQPKASRNAFHLMDFDKTGTIKVDEFCRALKELGIDEVEAQRLFECVDQTQSQTINYLEFLAATMDQRNVDEVALREAFRTLDTSHNGRISVNGLLELLQRSFDKDQVKDMIDSADITGDGCLNFDEFKAMFDDTPTAASKQVEIKVDDTGAL